MPSAIARKHNEQFEFGGRRFRALVPVGRPDAVKTWDINSTRRIVDLILRDGDHNPMDIEAYKATPAETRERCGLVCDLGDCKTRDPMAPLEMTFGLRLFQGDPVRSYDCGLAQWNTEPGPGEAWRPPPFAMQIMGERDKNTKPGDLEYLVFNANYAQGRGLGNKTINVEINRVEFVRGDLKGNGFTHDIRLRVENGQGGAGRAQAWINGVLVADHEGLLGYQGYSPLYPALQIYRAPLPRERGFTNVQLHARYENWREGLAA